MNKTLFTTYLLPLAITQAYAAENLTLKLNDGTAIVVSLAETPKYWLSGANLYLEEANGVQVFGLAQVQEVVFGEEKQSSSIVTHAEEPSLYPTLATTSVYLTSSTTEGITITNSSGTPMPVVAENEGTAVRIGVSHYPCGIYTLSQGSHSFKFIKGSNTK